MKKIKEINKRKNLYQEKDNSRTVFESKKQTNINQRKNRVIAIAEENIKLVDKLRDVKAFNYQKSPKRIVRSSSSRKNSRQSSSKKS